MSESRKISAKFFKDEWQKVDLWLWNLSYFLKNFCPNEWKTWNPLWAPFSPTKFKDYRVRHPNCTPYSSKRGAIWCAPCTKLWYPLWMLPKGNEVLLKCKMIYIFKATVRQFACPRFTVGQVSSRDLAIRSYYILLFTIDMFKIMIGCFSSKFWCLNSV